MKTDPATWREAARQLREELALLYEADGGEPSQAAFCLDSLARRFENEAKAAERASSTSAAARKLLPEKWRAAAMRATDIRALPGVAPESLALYQCAAELEAAEQAKEEA